MEAKNNCKVILIGDSNVGKTTFFEQFCKDKEVKEVDTTTRTVINTIGLDCKKKQVSCNG